MQWQFKSTEMTEPITHGFRCKTVDEAQQVQILHDRQLALCNGSRYGICWHSVFAGFSSQKAEAFVEMRWPL